MKSTDNKYVKRTQKDYPMSFKLSVVREYAETKEKLTHPFGRGIQYGSDVYQKLFSHY